MTFFVRRVVILFLVFELVVFVVLYCCGPKGLSKVRSLVVEQNRLYQDIGALQAEIESLKRSIVTGQSDFAKEKIAREKLLMKKDQESVYFI